VGILKLLLIITLAIVWPLPALLLVGVVRLCLGRRHRFGASLEDLSALRKGDILLVGKQSIAYDWYLQIPNVLTRRLKHRFWVHAAIYDGEGHVWEAVRSGVVRREIGVYRDHLIRAFRHRYLQETAKLDSVVAYCERQRDFGYGFGGMAFFVCSVLVPVSFNWLFDNPWLDRRLRLDRAYFCSELVVDAYASIGHRISPYDGWRVKPSDFIGNPMLQEVR
jgi:hypothetical protein